MKKLLIALDAARRADSGADGLIWRVNSQLPGAE